MKHAMRLVVSLLGVASFAVASTASGSIIVATFTGTVSSGYDYIGVFGAVGNLAGYAYVAKYTFDTTKGIFYDNLPFGEHQAGGSINAGAPPPVSGTITVGGVTQSFSGALSSIVVDEPFYSESVQYGAYDCCLTRIDNSATGIHQDNIFTSVPTTDAYISGQLYYHYDPGYPPTFPAYGAFADLSGNGTVQIDAGVPESGTWSFMFIGLAALGALTRSRRRASTSQA